MNRFKKIIRYVLVISILMFLFRGPFYRTFLNYSKVKSRSNITLTDKALIKEIQEKVNGKVLTLNEIIDTSNEITSERLNFTFENVSGNPNEITVSKKANCIGYSAMFNAIGNYLIDKQNQTGQYEFNHLVGQMDLLGFDIHSLFDSPFFKDHDFNEIRNKLTGEKVFVDPSLSDYLRIERVTSR